VVVAASVVGAAVVSAADSGAAVVALAVSAELPESLPQAAATTPKARSPATAVARRLGARLLVMVVLPFSLPWIVNGRDRDQWAPL
jgi:hypothetical protein